MIEILHDLQDPKLWEIWYIFLMMGKAGFISSTVVALSLPTSVASDELQEDHQSM